MKHVKSFVLAGCILSASFACTTEDEPVPQDLKLEDPEFEAKEIAESIPELE